MSKTAKIAISLPERLLQDIERERKARGETRSAFLRYAAEEFLRRKRVHELEQQYIRAYKKYPETKGERAIAESLIPYALADNPWEEDPES